MKVPTRASIGGSIDPGAFENLDRELEGVMISTSIFMTAELCWCLCHSPRQTIFQADPAEAARPGRLTPEFN
jgi:hypothetical protein